MRAECAKAVHGRNFSQDAVGLFYAQLLSGVAHLCEFGEMVVKSGVWQSGDCLYTEICGFSAFSVIRLVVSFGRMFCGVIRMLHSSYIGPTLAVDDFNSRW